MKKKTHTRTITVLLITGVLMYGAISLAMAAAELRDALELTESLQSEIESAEKENKILSISAGNLGSEESVRARAEEFFDFTDPHEIIFADFN